MKKMLFIMNPYAGQRKANRYLAEIITVFNRADYEVTIHMTAGAGDATRVARERAAEVDVIVCCGGDGTFNETVSGILAAGVDVPVGYIPAGTTNDFASSLKLPTNPLAAAQNIAEGEPVAYDVGSFGGRYFTYVASFGAFTKSSYATPQNIKNALGHTAYVLSGISELTQIRKEHVRLEMGDTVVEDDFIFGAICNSTSVGGILTLDPKLVDMSDGKFELMVVRAPKSLAEITECIQALQSQKYNCSMITFCSTDKVTVISSPEMSWTLDGEHEPGHEEIVVENKHLAIRLMRKVAHDA